MTIKRGSKSKYICDKCQQEIKGYHRNSKEYNVPNKYYKVDQWSYPRKDFDLCDKCEKELREWLKEKPQRSILDSFPIYEN